MRCARLCIAILVTATAQAKGAEPGFAFSPPLRLGCALAARPFVAILGHPPRLLCSKLLHPFSGPTRIRRRKFSGVLRRRGARLPFVGAR